jgi:phosphatidylserine/phosphatidylglycerophosphate/cardiolipin synthase-like enzyme
VADSAQDDLVRRILELGRLVPSGQLDALCKTLQSWDGTSTGALSALLNELPSPGVRRAVRQLVTRWVETGVGEPLRSLAWALRAAGSMDQWWRESQHLAVAWTGPSPAAGLFRRTDQALLEVIRAARSELWLVSFAGYKVPAVREALLRAAERDVAVHLVLESEKASKGKITFSALEGIGPRLAEVATVYLWPLERRTTNSRGQHGSLHVKCAVADEHSLFVSSANLTEFAMSLNMELGLLARGTELPGLVRRHLHWLREQGHLVSTRRS